MITIRYNRTVNAPAARTVAERPAPVKRRYNVWPCASSELEPRVISGLPRHAGVPGPAQQNCIARNVAVTAINAVPERAFGQPPIKGGMRVSRITGNWRQYRPGDRSFMGRNNLDVSALVGVPTSLPPGLIWWYDVILNVPVARRAALRPAPIKRRYNVWLCASSELEPQVNPALPRIADVSAVTAINAVPERAFGQPPIKGGMRLPSLTGSCRQCRSGNRPFMGRDNIDVSALAGVQTALHAELIWWYDVNVNVPVARRAALRPAPVKWRYNVWLCASSELEPQVNLSLPRIADVQNALHRARFQWYNNVDGRSSLGCRLTQVRNSPPECSSILTDCRAAGLHLLVILTLLQLFELGCVIADGHRVGHDPNEIVHDTQEVVVLYHLFLLMAYLPARRLRHRAGLVRH